MIVATAGHVDHGKTRLVHWLTGVETDRLEEEKSRGLTIDLGFAYTDLGTHRVGFGCLRHRLRTARDRRRRRPDAANG